jgi:type I restriction enzyme S subunit
MKYRLGDICSITKGATGIMKAIPGPYTMIALGERDKTHNEFQFDSKAVIIPLVSSTGHGHASMKRVKYCEGKFALGNILCAVIPKDENFVLAKYLHIYLHWNREELLVSQMKGMANVSLPMNRIADVMVTVPSIEKQKEIIDLEKKLVERELEADKLFSDQLTLIEKLNQVILQEAVQGKLVKAPSSLERAGGEADEPASELIKRIKAEKAKSGKKEKPLLPIKPEEIPFEIPESWVWCRLGEIAELKSGNQYSYPKSDNGIMFVKVGDMNSEGNEIEIKISSNYFERDSVKESDLIPTGSIIFPKRGGAIATNKRRLVKSEPILVDSNTMAVIPYHEISIDYFYQWFTTIDLSKLGNDGVIPQVNNKDLNPILFPLPPISEQKRIVAEIEKQFAKTKQLKEHIIANQQATEQLLKALLHQAFLYNEAEVKEGEVEEIIIK